MGFNFWGFEIDSGYCKDAQERLAAEMAQMRLLDIVDVKGARYG